MDKKIFSEGMEELGEIFPDKAFNVELYWKYLNDISDESFKRAIRDICSTTKEAYPNTNFIGIIRELATSGIYKLSGEAWEEVLKQVSSVGHWGKPKFKDPLIEKAVNGIGWKEICTSELISVERAHFTKAYDQLKERKEKEEIKLEDCKQINREGVRQIDGLVKGVL